MSAQDIYTDAPSTPSPAPRNIGTSMTFSRPARGKRSTDHLRKATSNVSMRKQMSKKDSDTNSTSSNDDELSRPASPVPSALSVGNASQIYLPQASRGGGIEMASEALQRLMEDAHSGSFAAGALGQKLLDQQEQMRRLMQQLEDTSEQEFESRTKEEYQGTSDSASHLLLEVVQKEITHMKQEQEDLVRELLQASNTSLGAIGVTSISRFEAESLLPSSSYGVMSESNSFHSLSATPTKPTSNNARELRRQRNAAAPNLNKDEALVNDIQAQLINELRRLQALVTEKEKTIAAMAESLEEFTRFKAMQEASIKKLETEKDAKDAHLYEAERKEAMVREENEDISRQLKKFENEVRLLRKQVNERTDASESLKVTNEDLELKVEETFGILATLRAKGAADLVTINGLKTQVGDLESKQRQTMDKIPASMSNLSNNASFDHSSMDSFHTREEMMMMMRSNEEAGKRNGSYDQALTPSASLDESLMNRLRPSEATKSLEAEVAKWKGAALKYRKKWTDERKEMSNDSRRKEQEYDDSTDEDEDIWIDQAAKGVEIRKRTTSALSRVVSGAGNRKTSKTMGDAFGIQRYNKPRSTSLGWGEEESNENADRSYGEDDTSIMTESSTRGSLDGFDPHFADPTIRTGVDSKAALKRRSAYGGSGQVLASKGSPLARQLQLPSNESDEEVDIGGKKRPTSTIFEPGLLGDELANLQEQEEGEDSSIVEGVNAEDSFAEDHQAMMDFALAEKDKEHETATSEREKVHATVLTQRDEEHDVILQERDAIYRNALNNKDETHQAAIAQRDDAHQRALTIRDEAYKSQAQALQEEHVQTLNQAVLAHSNNVSVLQVNHAQVLANRDEEHEAVIVTLQEQSEERIREVKSKQSKQHSEAMADARERHAEALSRAREEAQATLSSAQKDHKRLLEERQRSHEMQVEQLQSRHDRNLLQKDQELAAYMEDSETTNEMFYKAKDDAHHRSVTERDAVILVKEREIYSLKERLNSLEDEVEGLRRKTQSSEATAAVQSRNMEEMQSLLRVEKVEKAAMESRLNAMTTGTAKDIAIEGEDDFQDAIETSEGAQAVQPRSESVVDNDEAIKVIGNVARGEAAEGDAPAVSTLSLPKDEADEAPVHPTRENGAQTDDEQMSNIQSAPLSGVVGSGEVHATSPLSMPPPSTIPTKQTLVATTIASVVTDPTTEEHVPTSSLPAAQTSLAKTTQTKLRVPVPEASSRPSSRVSGPPPSAFTTRSSNNNKGLLPSTPRGSFANDDAHHGGVAGTTKRDTDALSVASRGSVRRDRASRRAPSAQSYVSEVNSDYSRVSGVSSRASDYRVDGNNYSQNRTMIVGPGGQAVSTDPIILSSITKTMIGDYLYKYTRRSLGRSGHSDRRHQRYFWVHPYTRTLYWTLQAPSEAAATEAINKSAFIQDVMTVDDHNNSPPGLYHKSILVMTQAREVKITAPTKEKHDLWINALNYLVNRELDAATSSTLAAPSEWRQSISSAARLRKQTSGSVSSVRKKASLLTLERNFASYSKKNPSIDALDRDRTPTGRGYSASQTSRTQRRNTAAKEFLEQWEEVARLGERSPAARSNRNVDEEDVGNATVTPTAMRKSARPSGGLANEMFGGMSAAATSTTASKQPHKRDAKYMTAEEMLEEDDENSGYEGLDNVRACCDGKHDIGLLAHKAHRQEKHRQEQQGRRSRSSTSTTTSSQPLSSPKKVRSKAERGPLQLTGSAVPQLGPLSLNTINSSSRGKAMNSDPLTKFLSTNTAKANSSDWFGATEFGAQFNDANMAGDEASHEMAKNVVAPSSSAASFSERVHQIQNARQKGINSLYR
ncbi:hypothetical protein CBS101457_001488 [Exobasidium rhododendri]|nr:hypothetical protein CBS101457_001488 [Exobasidium rhododendri]